jgi:hypothetical protein
MSELEFDGEWPERLNSIDTRVGETSGAETVASVSIAIYRYRAVKKRLLPW